MGITNLSLVNGGGDLLLTHYSITINYVIVKLLWAQVKTIWTQILLFLQLQLIFFACVGKMLPIASKKNWQVGILYIINDHMWSSSSGQWPQSYIKKLYKWYQKS